MLLLNISIHSATYMKKCTNSCAMESSSNMQNVDLMLHQDRQAQAYYQKRYSNPLLEDQVLNKHKMQDRFNFCQMANEQGVRTKRWSRSNTNNPSRHSKSLQHSSDQNYRRTQSNSIFELCSCLSASSNSSTSSTS